MGTEGILAKCNNHSHPGASLGAAIYGNLQKIYLSCLGLPYPERCLLPKVVLHNMEVVENFGDAALQAVGRCSMWMGLFTVINHVVSPRHMSVIVAVVAEGAVLNIQTFGASFEGILTSEDFLTSKEHLAKMLAVFLTYRAVMQESGLAMTLFLDIHYGYNADVIGAVYYYLDANTFGMVPTWHYGILRCYCNYYFILMCTCL